MKTRRFSKAHATIMEACGFWVDARNGAAQFHRDMGRKGTWLGKITLSPNLRFYQGVWINVEYVAGKIIEVHLRWNDDFSNHNCDVIYPVWRDEPMEQPPNTTWYASPGGDRLGFWVGE
jgi:hypothetical protein